MVDTLQPQFVSEYDGQRSGTKRISFGSWSGALDDALQIIPEDEDYPHALIKLLAEQRAGRRKKICLVTRDGSPIAIAPLRKANAFVWQPVTQYILPGIVIPAVRGELSAALDSLGLNIRVALWRTEFGPPSGPRVRDVTRTVTYGMKCSEDFEAYWKKRNVWRYLRSAQTKWGHLTLTVNAPGAAEWIISNWARKWGVLEDEAEDRIIAAKFLEARGQHYALLLCDGDQKVAGVTSLIHRGDMIGQSIYRQSEDGNLGNHLIHLAFRWAREQGFNAVDIGGGHDYKRRFAPPGGERYEFTVSPFWRYAPEKGLRAAKSRLRALLKPSHSKTQGAAT